MVEYVYARHDFVPEHEDEVAFRAGERIEVIERDDIYSDGWWQVRSLRSPLLFALARKWGSPSLPSSLLFSPFPAYPVLVVISRRVACSNLRLLRHTSPLTSQLPANVVGPLIGHGLMEFRSL